jgi:hypothetical protein
LREPSTELRGTLRAIESLQLLFQFIRNPLSALHARAKVPRD